MDKEIVAALWFECNDLSDIERTLLQALAYHCHNTLTCWPSVLRLSKMIHRTQRHTRRLIRFLEEMGYISVKVQKGRNHSNLYTINRTRICPISQKRGHVDVPSKPDILVSSELLREEERRKEENPEALLLKLGLTPGTIAWNASMNGHGREISGS